MPWRTQSAAALAAAAILAGPAAAQNTTTTTTPDVYQENIALHQEIDGLRARVGELTGFLVAAKAQFTGDQEYRAVLERRLAEMQRRTVLQRRVILRLRAATQSTTGRGDVVAAIAMMMTPGGTLRLGPKGWLYVESGTTAAGSAALRVRTGLRGWRVRVWEDGSTRVWWRGHRLLTACITGKGCED